MSVEGGVPVTDTDDLLTRVDDWLSNPRSSPWSAAQLLRDLAAQLAAARTVTRRLAANWLPHEDHWDRYKRPNVMVDDADEPMSDAERAWLASVSPPTSREEP